MNFSIFKIFQIFGVVSNWATQALADGRITLAEAVDLAMQIAKILGVTIEIELPTSLSSMTAETIEPYGKKANSIQVKSNSAGKPMED